MDSLPGRLAFSSTAKRRPPGIISCKSLSRFNTTSLFRSVKPVRLPPGRFNLATRPVWTGSRSLMKTTGMVEVAALAARVVPACRSRWQ
jgi:hypothetical protein